jgi:hypothetical protein
MNTISLPHCWWWKRIYPYYVNFGMPKKLVRHRHIFLKVWWQDAILFVYFSNFYNICIYIHSFNHIHTIHFSLANRWGLSPIPHWLYAQWETPPCGAEPRIELGPALQQADAPRRTMNEPRRTINAPRRTIFTSNQLCQSGIGIPASGSVRYQWSRISPAFYRFYKKALTWVERVEKAKKSWKCKLCVQLKQVSISDTLCAM